MSAIATIGYENQTLADVIGCLKASGVRLLIDIRDAPVSRKPGFSKKMLGASLEEAGIRYWHVRALGTPKPGRDAAKRGDMTTFRQIYDTRFSSADARLAFAEVVRAAHHASGCLLCYEQDHTKCHRQIVADAMAAEGFTVAHLRVAPRFL
jgi:uncharacterized protein (DUF488 family)